MRRTSIAYNQIAMTAHSRLRSWAPMLTLAMFVLAAEAVAAVPTAVFTLDAYHATLHYNEEHPLGPQLRELAESARIVSGGAIFRLDVSEGQPSLRPIRPGNTGEDDLEPVPVTLALFRDLDEIVYLAACPAPARPANGREQRRPSRIARSGRRERAGEPSKADIEDCRDVEAGQTFSVEFEEDRMQVVVRGRQVPFAVFRVQDKKRRIDSPYELTSSKLPAPVGPAPSTPPAEGMAPQSRPQWEPPEAALLSHSRPSEPVRTDVAPARTSLRAGRVGVTCDSTRAQVYIDGAYVGACPIETPLVAGRHSVLVRMRGAEEWVREFRVDAGETVRLRAGEQ